MRKLATALSCENLFINGIGYIKDGNLSYDNIDNTNLYEVRAKMLKNGESINNTQGDKDEEIVFDGDFNIPAFLYTGDGFIKT